jgi:hypothetical protein
MTASASIGFILSLIAYFTPHGTVAHAWGTLAVIISTGLMVIASLAIALAVLPRWFLVLLDVLIILDILGTGACAYFLETDILLAFMVIALIAWIVHLVNDGRAAPYAEHL